VKFIDEAVITVESGRGGAGCVSFRRERFIPKGGPDGGDGGNGGSIVLRASSQKRTLYQFRHRQHFKARNGMPGQGKQKTGRSGADIVIEIPPGTLVSDAETGELIRDFVHPGETLVLVRGGRGGRGNARFKSSTNRTPRYAQPGEPGQARKIRLELKLLADVGLVGLPNAGKSTLIRTISAARPKTADYPFTTLTPQLGVVHTDWSDPFVVADIPGLIEGAHEGAGLGIRFLRHIERTRVLVHLIDVSALDPGDPLKAYDTINREMARYNRALAEKPQIVVLNKIDRPDTAQAAAAFEAALPEKTVQRISALEGTGVRDLLSEIVKVLDHEQSRA